MSKFHIATFDGMAGIGYYAVRDSDQKESRVFPVRWMAWLAGRFM